MNHPPLSNLTQHLRRCACASWLVPVLLLVLPAPIQAQFTYITNNGTITITGYTGPGGAVTIPSTIDGLAVTCIGAQAFKNRTTLTSVTIPNSVTSIDSEAFQECTGLTSAAIPNSITTIRSWAFSYCTSLANLTMPSTVTSLGEGALAACTSLTSFTIPNSITNIANSTFSGCGSLTSITIPNSVTSIGDTAFNSCDGLINVSIPNSVTNIGNAALAGCTSLLAITVETLNPSYSSVDGVLFNRSQTILIQCPGGKPGNYAIPNGVTSIADGALAGCRRLTKVTIPNSIAGIGDWAFQGCIGLTSVIIPNGVTNLGRGAFYVCTSLASVAIPNSVASIPSYMVAGCYSLPNITIPDGITSIGDSAFLNCTSLRGVYFMGNAPSLGGGSVFSGDDNVTVYYLLGTTGWGSTFGGRPTALWALPTILTPPQTQTAEAGSAVSFWVEASGGPVGFMWFRNGTNRIACWSGLLQLPSVLYSQAGAYTVVVTNLGASVTSAPAFLNVIAPLPHRLVPALTLIGQPGTLLNLDFTAALEPAPTWTTFDQVLLTEPAQWYFDLAAPVGPQRFYRIWQAGLSGVPPGLDVHSVPAITLTGAIGNSLRVDYINQFGPTDAWATLATVTLTNTTQPYLDTSVIGQPPRLWRVVLVP